MPRGFLDEPEQRSPRERGERDYAEVACIKLAGETAKAVRVDAGTKVLWLPKKNLSAGSRERVEAAEEGTSLTLSIATWFAKKEGLL